MLISKYTEDFVKLCVKEHYRTDKYPDYNNWGCADSARIRADREMEEDVIKILFRIEHYDEPDAPSAHVVAEIIDVTIGSNYCKKRPSDESLHDIVKHHISEGEN